MAKSTNVFSASKVVALPDERKLYSRKMSPLAIVFTYLVCLRISAWDFVYLGMATIESVLEEMLLKVIISNRDLG